MKWHKKEHSYTIFYYLCVIKQVVMDELKHFSLTHLKQLLENNDEGFVDNYISQNLVVARNVQLSLIKSQFEQGALQMPEMRILMIKKGWVAPIINMTPRHFEVGDLVFLGPNGIVQFSSADEDVHGIGISMTDELFGLAIGNLIPKAFDGHLREFHFHLEPNEMEFLDHIHHLIYINTRAQEQSSQVTLHLLSSFLWYVDYLWSRHEEANRQSQTREQRLFSDFIQLVSRDAAQQHQVEYYASCLCLSPRYVSTLIKNVSGKTAKEWIDDAIIIRTKIALKHTDKSIVQIADDICFPNPSFFCKFFKRMTGMTPLEYRKSNQII